jgi:hypothetical protein
MKTTRSYWFATSLLFILVSGLIFGLTSCDRKARQKAQFDQLARDAFSYGYPLVLMDTSAKYVAALSNQNIKSNDKTKKIPMYQFYHIRKVGDPRFKDVLAYDNDMLYSTAWLNLAQDPVVLTVPATNNRYFVGGLVEGWSNIFGVVGSRSTGNQLQRFFITGPQWQGATPKNMKPLRSQTNLVWLPFRVYANNGKDLRDITAFQDGLKLTPLSQWAKNKSAQGFFEVDPKLNLKVSPRESIFNMTAEEYYRTLCNLMVDNPPGDNDTPFMEQVRKLGVVPTRNFRFHDLPIESQQALSASLKNARSFMLSQQRAFTPTGRLVNGWTMPVDRTLFGVDYARRAYESYMGLGNLPPQDLVVATIYEDNMGQQLMGENSFKVTFAKGQLPPVNAFWSLTMYQLPEMAFAGNRYRRYSVNSNSPLKTNADGSVSIYLQPKSPGSNQESNWLPSVSGNYQLTLRMYWPKSEILEGRWSPPVIERVGRARMAKF